MQDLLNSIPPTMYKSPIEFRKRFTTTTTDTSRFQYLPVEDRSHESVMVIIGSPVKTRNFTTPTTSIHVIYEDHEILFEDLIENIQRGMQLYPPEMCEEGMNGTYFLRNENGNMIAVFKPQDEEGNSEDNPKRANNSDIIRKGILCGEGAQREVAAFLLDHKDNHFVGVPRTTMVSITHPSFGKTKIGSLQEFVENEGASWDISCHIFSDYEVQKIATFDLRIFNNDRHGGNMLMKEDRSLTPIDHGFSLSSTLDGAWFDWLTWPQVKKPINDECLQYILNLNSINDLKCVKKLNIRKECLRTMKISTMLLKKGAKEGLNLFQIGNLVSRMVLDEPSSLERMIRMTLNQMGYQEEEEGMEEEKEEEFLLLLGRIMEEEIIRVKEL